MPLLYDQFSAPKLIRPGSQGVNDLRYHSVPVTGSIGDRTVKLAGSKTVSYSQLFATQPWVAAAVMRMLTMAIRVPLKVYRRTGDDSRERLRDTDHPLAAAIITPWEKASQADLIMAMLGPLLVHGNALLEVDQGRSDKIRFDSLDWRFANPIHAIESVVSGWEMSIDSEIRMVGADTVLQTSYWSPLGPLGISPLQQLGTTLNVEDAAQRYQSSLFQNGARPPSAITASEEFLGLEPGERNELLTNLRADITALYAGPENSGRPALLPPGLDWKPIGHTAVEAALIEQRKVAREEVCAVYQIPPPMLGILDRATFSNIEVQREMAYTLCLGPPLALIEQAINAHLVKTLLREDDIYVEFDFAGVLRGDPLKEVQSLRSAIDIGLMTRNEGRSILNMPRSDQEGMDAFYHQANNEQQVGASETPEAGVEGEGDDPSIVDFDVAELLGRAAQAKSVKALETKLAKQEIRLREQAKARSRAR